jgi:hypothetical protein
LLTWPVTVKSAALGPSIGGVLKDTSAGDAPQLVSTVVRVTGVPFTCTLPKSRLAGFAHKPIWTPTPVSWTSMIGVSALSVSISSVAWRGPAADGVN